MAKRTPDRLLTLAGLDCLCYRAVEQVGFVVAGRLLPLR